MARNQKKHLLVKKAFIFPENKRSSDPPGCRYDFANGGWMHKEDGQEVFLVKSKHPARFMAGTKKADLETGEDQKGG